MKQLWTNGTIYTMENETATVEAVLVENGKIAAVGADEQLRSLADEVMDLQQSAMYPGFVDSHLHIIGHGDKLQRLDLTAVQSAEQLLQVVKDTAQYLQPREWLIGDGWNENQFLDGRIPTNIELDAVCENPVILNRVCHHVVLANSTAIKAGGLTKEEVDPEGGKIGRHKNGALNGLFYDQATKLVTSALPTGGTAYKEALKKSLSLAIDDMLSYGLTGGHTEDMSYYGSYENPLTAFNEVIGTQQNFRVHLLRHHTVFEQMMKDRASYKSPFIEAGAMKIFADGSFGGSTAALLESYASDPQNYGLLIHTNEQMESYIQLARKYEEAIAVHLIGDAAIEQVLTLVEKYPAPKGKRDRFIHCCLVSEDQLARMKKLPIILDLQPAFVPSDFPWVLEKLGTERKGHLYAWKTFIDEGFMCAAGTDAPIEAICPLKNIYAAVERKKVTDTHEGYFPEQKLSRYEAIKMYTVGSAQAICKEHKRGLIKVGYDADFSIFDRDLLNGTIEQMLKAKVLKTVVAGKVVFERK
ncbi:amidohydrolase [Lysinibacillus sp. 2017]|uniref:amidohydrolase n=1 Tax=unclassified Lysinibacillus TaxID=2636778 RepID=UPI000D528BF3|nr:MULTISPECIES: amidohydrolase [unclassified Lysinibacillus]AWE08989.1 amidohydrolase [Lysinibacillus sp. 2017]TGN35502.1 amidohydrolase [Lysinibacillus sp. S2017]